MARIHFKSFLHSMIKIAILTASLGLIAGCSQSSAPIKEQASNIEEETQTLSGQQAKAYFAGGCFWCVESDFEKLPGVYEAISGYSGGSLQSPTYEAVSYTETGHLEAVEVVYDPTVVNFRTLVDFHLRHIDPTDEGGQFCDRGSSYRTAIFVQSEDENKAAKASLEEAATLISNEIVTPILQFEKFWIAEDYHQDYYKKNPIRYGYYRRGCGRDRRVKEVWQAQ